MWELWWRFSVFVRQKVTANENVSFIDYTTRTLLSDCYKLVANRKNDNDATIFKHDIILKLFWRCFVSLVKFSYWSKFLVNIIIGSGVMTIYFYKELTRNPEIGNTPGWVFSNIWRLERVGDTKFGTDVSDEMLLNAAKCLGYSFYRFWVIKTKPTR